MQDALIFLIVTQKDEVNKEDTVRYAILGANGQLGRELIPRLAGEVYPLARAQADLTRAEELYATIAQLRPDVIVNCAAYNFVDRAESEPAAAFAVNAWGVRDLARMCRELDTALVQFSSDYVFGLDDNRQTPYAEDEAPGPVSVYGLSKLAGEYLVRSLCPRHIIIRTCGLYGAWGVGGKGGNFVETILKAARQGKPLRVVADQTCSPSYAADVAAATVALLATGQSGVYHLTNSGAVTWYEFARAILELSKMPAELSPITSAEYGAAARRPRYSVLATEKIVRLGLPPMRSWQAALAAYLQERLSV